MVGVCVTDRLSSPCNGDVCRSSSTAPSSSTGYRSVGWRLVGLRRRRATGDKPTCRCPSLPSRSRCIRGLRLRAVLLLEPSHRLTVPIDTTEGRPRGIRPMVLCFFPNDQRSNASRPPAGAGWVTNRTNAGRPARGSCSWAHRPIAPGVGRARSWPGMSPSWRTPEQVWFSRLSL